MTLNPESWLRQQRWRILWQGPGGSLSVFVDSCTVSLRYALVGPFVATCASKLLCPFG
jgi:hypothetical protein